ncbi:phytoene synthase [Candidatus Kinetoplastibacterium oncopeltii TCC290E]|uniref:Phytoene synthase n=1 Tax=Candidatus Kinetoplastidibacterium stringomonadis TCC290E TaxID=1208920 RepID=M1M865_9PROT|nr:squalene/phytoene synthase family protein [Candidatus Kinetoplastibacterium oncopeltii]AGF48200.1 phytoene synthase [Candidatus Kinetoplastibacterium oncopeltii TCC290E]
MIKMTPNEYCEKEFAPAGSNIYYATILLPNNKKRALISMYAIHKKIENILSDCHTKTVAYSKISWWKNQIYRMQKEVSDHPITKELSLYTKEYPFIYDELISFINNIENILEKDFFHNWSDLYNNYWTVNRVICKLFNKVFYNNDDKVSIYNEKIGLAMQLTSSIQDIYINAKNGIIFLPYEDLNHFSLRIENITDEKKSENFKKFIQFQINRAKKLYKESITNIHSCHYKNYKESFAIAAINYATLEKIDSYNKRDSNKIISISPIKKLWVSWRTLNSNGNNFIKKLLPLII